MNFDVRRRIYIAIALLTLGLCILIVLCFARVPFIRGFLGDLLIVILIYSVLKAVYDFAATRLAIAVLLFSFLVEGLQYLKFAQRLEVSEYTLARLTIGAVFDPMDLLAYTLGVGLICSIDLRLSFLKK